MWLWHKHNTQLLTEVFYEIYNEIRDTIKKEKK